MENGLESRSGEGVASFSQDEDTRPKAIIESDAEGKDGTTGQSHHVTTSSSMSELSSDTSAPASASNAQMIPGSNGESSSRLSPKPDDLEQNSAADTAEPNREERDKEGNLNEVNTEKMAGITDRQTIEHSLAQHDSDHPPEFHIEASRAHAQEEVPGNDGAVDEEPPPAPDTQDLSDRRFSWGNEDTDLPWTREVTNEVDDPGAFLAGITRSTTFPEVPVRELASRGNPADALPPPTAEESRTKIEHGAAHTSEMDAPDSKVAMNPPSTTSRPNDPFTYSEQNFEVSNAFPNMTESQPDFFNDPTDAESRYDEGLPLIQKADDLGHGSKQADVTQQSSRMGTPTGGPTHDHGENLKESAAANVEKDEGLGFTFHPPERKSTEQVLGSFHITSNQEAKEDPVPGTSQEAFSDSAHSQIIGAAAESSWPTDMEQPKEEVSYNMDGGPPEDQDLAAMWQAALGDDELLDDSDSHMDTTQFFSQGEEAPVDQPWDANLGGTHQNLDMSTSSVLHNSIVIAASSSLNMDSPQDDWLAQQTQPSVASTPASNSQPRSVPNNPATHPAPYQVSSTPANYSPPVLQSSFAQQHPQPWPQQHQQRPEMTKAQSFADKSKGGYSSPYDLPTDITKPRKRGHVQHNVSRVTSQGSQQAALPPPPRSSSMYAHTQRGVSEPLPNPFLGRSSSISSVSQQPITNTYQPAAPPVKPSPSSSSFFEDLPITTNPRRSSNSGRFTPHNTLSATQQSVPPPPPPVAGQSYNRPYGAPAEITPRQPSAPPMAVAAEQLRAPERFGPFDIPPQPSSVLPQTSTYGSRYSPAPPPQPTIQGRAKYAPLPTTAPPSNKSPYQPRTSSPLSHPPKTTSHKSKSSSGSSIPGNPSYLPQEQPGDGSRFQQAQFGTTGFSQGERERPMVRAGDNFHQNVNEQDRLSMRTATVPSSQPKQPVMNYSNQDQVYNPSEKRAISPPRRSQTQSPGAAQVGHIRSSAVREPYQRPASVNVPAAPASLFSSYPSLSPTVRTTRTREVSHTLNYIVPNDGRENDPLCRWRGCPIISWGFGGVVVTTFPKHVQRYSTGQQYPSIKCSPGEVRTHSLNNIIPIEEHVARFSGPLRGKGKKKDVLSWLSLRIEQLAREESQFEYDVVSGNPQKREERLLLLKILRILIENDGLLGGSEVVQKAVFDVFSSHIQLRDGDPQPALALGNQVGGLANLGESDGADAGVIESIRRTLLGGNRESAIWQAVDKRLWAHAMIISSTLNRDIWKQVVQEFVRQELRPLGGSAKSLSALYEVFGGNWEESIDELVPASARAGYQLVNKNTDSTSNKNALEGLEKWTETLMLILSNRTADDGQALAALGKLLIGYGRVEAAHICYMFARPFSSFSGPDDPQASIALIGANHLNTPFNPAAEVESILLSEVYEFGTSLATSTPSSSVPHLQAYKLYHALLLAEHGYRSEAQQYCDAILATIRSSTKPSGYHHGLLIAYLDDFSRRLQQSPKDGTSSWISKPSMEKVSGSLFAKFNSFVAGDENDSTSAPGDKDGGVNDVGPFARIAGNTPSISRPSSQNDIRPAYKPHNTYSAGVRGASSGAPNRYSPYIPAGPYVPQAPYEQEPQSIGSQSLPSTLNRAVTEPTQSVANSYMPSEHLGRQEANSMQASYISTAPSESTYGSWEPQGPQNESSFVPPSNMPNGDAGSESATYGYHPYRTEDNSDRNGFNQSNGSITQNSDLQQSTISKYQPSSYEPPTSYTYEPPSTEPPDADTQNDTGSANKGGKLKSSFDDDDDDELITRAAELAKRERKQKDKEAEENFRKAAEADAKLGQHNNEKKGWFGGWFGKKDQNAGPGPIKAKLGEESSFYYDTELKKWVNKKGGTPQTSSASTPPPPKGPPTRDSSSAPPISSTTNFAHSSGPPPTSGFAAPPPRSIPAPSKSTPPGPPSRVNTPARIDSPAVGTDSGPPPGTASEPKNESAAPPPTGPPSRPATSMSNASSIDDLLGPAGARKGGTIKKSKKGRGYVDVMAKS